MCQQPLVPPLQHLVLEAGPSKPNVVRLALNVAVLLLATVVCSVWTHITAVALADAVSP